FIRSPQSTEVRRSSNPVDIGTLELALGPGRSPPEEGCGLAVPGGDHGAQRGLDLGDGAADPPGEGVLVEDLPEALDQVEPGGRLGQGHGVEAAVPQFQNI